MGIEKARYLPKTSSADRLRAHTYVDALGGLSPRVYTRISYADLQSVPFSTNASMLPSPG